VLRRSFLLDAAAFLATPLAVRAQQPGKTARIGRLSPLPAFLQRADQVVE